MMLNPTLPLSDDRRSFIWKLKRYTVGECGVRAFLVAHNPISPIRSTGSLPLHLTASDSGLILG